jgi:hypothetical protein
MVIFFRIFLYKKRSEQLNYEKSIDEWYFKSTIFINFELQENNQNVQMNHPGSIFSGTGTGTGTGPTLGNTGRTGTY